MMCKKLLLTFVLTLGLVSGAWAQPGFPVSQDIGGPAIPGSVAYSPGTGYAGSDEWTIEGSGGDIWGSWDQFQFVFRPLVGDGEASVRIASMTAVHSWAKAGVMIRESLNGGSKYGAMMVTGANGIGTQWRTDNGGGSANEMIAGFAPPHWLRVVRTGNVISTFQSFAGDAFWLPAQVLEIPMNETVYVGMFVTSHDNGQLETVVFDAVDLQAPPVLSAWNISPADGATDVPLDAVISWAPGDTATGHKVYFGDATPPPEIGDQALEETTYTPALAPSMTYYYQIDEIDGDAGEIRSFSTVSGAASGFSANLLGILSWTAGITADSHDVYFGTSDPPEFAGNVNILADVTGPGDAVLGVPNDGDWPGGEPPAFAIDDNTGTKYLHFKGGAMATGIQVEPASGPSVVTGLSLTTANDDYGRDPVTFELSGSNDSIDGPYTLIASGDIDDFAQAEVWPRFTMNATPISFENDVAYSYYQIVFPSLRPDNDGKMQIAEIELLSVTDPSFDPSPLEADTTYYYQIDAVAGENVYPGVVLSFTTPPRGVGRILREVWYGIGGTAIADLTSDPRFPNSPDESGYLSIFESPTNVADNYGQKVSGFLLPPNTGDYTFWIATDDGGHLRLSTDADPANAVLIAEETSWSGVREWHDDESMSPPMPLTAGEAYYIEALQKEGGGGDNLAVAWEGPGVPFDVIPGSLISLSPLPPLEAYNLLPPDGTSGLGMTNTLSWLPGATAYSFDVYVGTDPDELEFVGNQTETSLTLDSDLGATVYWRVDAVEADGTTKYPSAVSSFSTANNRVVDDFDAYDDLPAPVAPSGAGPLVDLRADDLPDGAVATDWINRGTLADFAPQGNPVVEEVDGVKAVTFDGESWFDGPKSVEGIDGASARSITVVAYNPDIPAEETMVAWAHRGGPDGTNISFNYGNHGTWGAVGHWGSDGDTGWWGKHSPAPAANNWWHLTYTYDGTAVRVYVNGAEESYNPVPLNTHPGETIRIGGQNKCDATGPSGCHKFSGSIAEVQIYDYALSQGEVMYLAGERAEVSENPLADTWSESGFVNASGGAGTMEVESFALPGLPYYLGQVSRIVPFADMSAGGGKALSIWFSGDEGNAAEFMYASLSDGAGQSGIVLYDGDADDLANPDWREWNIDMRDFGVDLANANELSIGIAGLDGSAAGDVINFDDIRVYTGRCMPDRIKPEADINNDCVVNMADAEEIMDAWGFSPLGWQIEWISDESPEGYASYDAGTETWTVTGHGHDIWDNADDFEYVFQRVSGDCEISARVVDMPGPSAHSWSKAGVMIRETNAEGSKQVIEAMTGGGGGGAGMQWRTSTNGGSGWSNISEPVVEPPRYVRLVRTGNLIEGFQSDDGVTWEKETEIENVMAEEVLIGLAVTSHESGVMRSGVFDNINIVGELVPMPTPAADLNDDDAVDWGDLIILLTGWLDEELWPY
jgi:regulation of enolase protein 1 (concanavalin A-like superfamily)